MFTVQAANLNYKPAAPGLGESPTYLVTERNAEGMSIELHYTQVPDYIRSDANGVRLNQHLPAWKLIEYSRDDDAMDDYWFQSFAAADAKAAELLASSYDHDELMAGG